MINPRELRIAIIGWSTATALGMLACTEPSRDAPVTGPVRQLMTASDSAAFLAQRGQQTTPLSPDEGVPIHAGESAVFTITSAECASTGSVLTVSGALSGTISQNACFDVGATLTLGPAAADGLLFFEHNDPRFGPGSFQFTGSYPSFTVFNDDGFGDHDFNDSVVSVELLTACQHNVLRLPQDDSRWGGKQYDNQTGETIGDFGCALTALTMALNFAGIQQTPGDLNQFMIDNKLFSKTGGITWEAPVASLAGSQGLKFQRGATTSRVELARKLCATGGRPIVVGVQGSDATKFPSHFVVATGVENGRIVIADPGHSSRTFLDDPAYKNKFEERGSVKDPPGDISALEIVVDNADLLVADPASRETGIRFSTGEKVVEIPQSGHFVDALDNDRTGEAATSITSSVGVFQPAEGTYQIQVRAHPERPQELSIHRISSDGRPQPVQRIPLNLSAGQVATYNLTFSRSGPVVFITIAMQTRSGINTQVREVIRTEARWSEFWAQLNTSNLDPTPPPPELPHVDFTREVVIAVATGSRPTTGYAIQVNEVRVAGTAISVALTEVSPGTNCIKQQVITQPVHVVRAPLADVPQSQFTVSQQTTICP